MLSSGAQVSAGRKTGPVCHIRTGAVRMKQTGPVLLSDIFLTGSEHTGRAFYNSPFL